MLINARGNESERLDYMSPCCALSWKVECFHLQHVWTVSGHWLLVHLSPTKSRNTVGTYNVLYNHCQVLPYN